jgi:hypothetical protein
LAAPLLKDLKFLAKGSLVLPKIVMNYLAMLYKMFGNCSLLRRSIWRKLTGTLLLLPHLDAYFYALSSSPTSRLFPLITFSLNSNDLSTSPLNLSHALNPISHFQSHTSWILLPFQQEPWISAGENISSGTWAANSPASSLNSSVLSSLSSSFSITRLRWRSHW